MSRRKHSRFASHDRPDVDVTAFLNLMVVLIPFLLMSAAFNQLSIFEVQLPADVEPASAPLDPGEEPQLEILLLSDQMIVSDRVRGALLAVPHLEDGAWDIAAMQGKLIQIKLEHPSTTQITLLSEPQIDYERIIEVMDNARAVVVREKDKPSMRELFPDISLGAISEGLL